MSDYNDLMKSLKGVVTGVADIAKDIASVAGDKAKDFATGASDMAKSYTRTAKLKLELNAEKEKANEVYCEIGKLCFELADKHHPDPLYVRLFDQVLIANSNIEAMQAELTELQAAMAQDDAFEDVDFEEVVSASEGVDFEEVVAAAECVCEDVADAVEDCCENVADAAQCVCDEVSGAVEDCCCDANADDGSIEVEIVDETPETPAE